MKKLIIIVALLATFAAACGSSSDSAATVNGETIDASLVDSFAGGEEATPVTTAQALSTLIQWTITEQAAAADFSFEPSDEDVQKEIDDVVTQAGVTDLAELADNQGVPEEVIRRYIVQLMVQDEVTTQIEPTVDVPTDDEVATELVDNVRDWTVVCTSHILVATQEEAQAALDRVENGEDFATVATEVSTDTASAANGGDLGCKPASAFVDEYADAAMNAELDTPTGPIESQFGFHVLIVTSRELATEDEVQSALKGDAIFSAADDWFLAAVQAADVEVDESYGTWVTDPSPSVIPAT